MSEISETLNNFFNFNVFDDESDKLYCCDSIVIYKNELYKSLKDNNDRNPHDDTAWFYIGTLSDIINYIVADDTNYQLDISYYPECEKSCKCMFSQGQCVVDRSPKLDADGISLKDDCGKPIYEYLIYNSLIDCNTTTPKEGSQANPPTWSQGMTTCEYLNRSVGYTQNGDTEENIISALNRKCLLGCDAPDDETIALATQGTEGTHSQTIGNKLRVIHDNKSIVTSPEKGLEVAVIGRDRAGNPVDVRNNPCFVTCETMGKGLIWDETTKKWIVNIANGLSYTSDGKIQVQPADNSIEVTQSGILTRVIGYDINGELIDAKTDPCLISCNDVNNSDFYIANGQLHVTKQCEILTNPSFEVYCNSSSPTGVYDQLIIDSSASSGNITSRLISWSPNYNGTNFYSAFWYPIGTTDVITTSDPELINNGGTILLTLTNPFCEPTKLIKKINPCCNKISNLFYSNIGQSSATICHPVNLASGIRHIQLDKDASIYPGYEGYINPYSRVVITNNSHCNKRFKIRSFVSLHRADDTADGIGGGFGGVPKTRALLQTRLGIEGDPYLDRVYFHTLYSSHDAGQWLLDRSVAEAFSGMFDYGSHSDFGDSNPFSGVVTVTNQDLEITLTPNETKTIALKMHVYWEKPLDPEDSDFNSIERLHFASNIIAHEVI